MLDLAFWAGKRVFVTGDTGFKGSWLALWLTMLGARVDGIGLAPQGDPNLFSLLGTERDVAHKTGDIRDLEWISRTMRDAKPDVVFHLAAQSLVRASYDDPVGTFATNIQGTAHVLEAVRTTPSVRSVVVVTSDKCYENRGWHWGYRETEALGGKDPYSASKAGAEIVTSAYRASFFQADDSARIATARAGNVIGGGDWARDRLVPDIIAAIQGGDQVVLRYPEAVRPWQHVLEPLCGYLRLAELLHGDNGAEFATGWNFGPDQGTSVSVADLASMLYEAYGLSPSWRRTTEQQPPEAALLLLDSSLARVKLGVHALLSISQTAHWTMSWFKRLAQGESARELCKEQIAAYQGIA